MALEDLVGPDKFLDALVREWPTGTDPKSEGDDHIRGVKNVILNTFGALDELQEYLLLDGGVMTGTVSNLPLAADDGAIDLTTNNNFTLTPAGDIEIAIVGPVLGQSGFLYVDNTGAHTITFAANLFYPGGEAPILAAGLHLLGYYSPDGVIIIITSAVLVAQA